MNGNKKCIDSSGLKIILESLKKYIEAQNGILKEYVIGQDSNLSNELIEINNNLIDEINTEVAARELLEKTLNSHIVDEYNPLKEKVNELDQEAVRNLGANQEILGDLKIKKSENDSNFTGNLYVQGNLIVDGETTTVTHESITIKDHTFIINSDGDDLSTLDDSLSGLVIRKDAESAYGIMYDPIGDGVKIGLGSIEKGKDFNYDSGEAQFLATRADSIIDGNLPKWHSDKKQFIDSGISVDSLLTDQNISQVAKSGLIEDLSMLWDTELIFDGGNADVVLAILDDTELM